MNLVEKLEYKSTRSITSAMKKANREDLLKEDFTNIRNKEKFEEIVVILKEYLPKIKQKILNTLEFEEPKEKVPDFSDLELLDKIPRIPSKNLKPQIKISQMLKDLGLVPNTDNFTQVYYRVQNIIGTPLKEPKADFRVYQDTKNIGVLGVIEKYPDRDTISIHQAVFMLENPYMFRPKTESRFYPTSNKAWGGCLFGHEFRWVSNYEETLKKYKKVLDKNQEK